MQLSSYEDTVKRWCQGEEKNETMDPMPREKVDISPTQALNILKKEDYLSNDYSLFSNNCQQLVTTFIEDMDEGRVR